MAIKNLMSARNLKRALAIGGLCVILSGCKPSPTVEMKRESDSQLSTESSGYSVTRIAVFKDDLAYGDRRGIYEIVDNNTGKKYIGISGIGICEVGSHGDGNSSTTDER